MDSGLAAAPNSADIASTRRGKQTFMLKRAEPLSGSGANQDAAAKACKFIGSRYQQRLILQHRA